MATWFKRRNGHIFDISLHGFPVGMIKSCRKYWSKEIADSIVQLKDIRFVNPQTKQVQLVYVQISQNTFVELQPANGRPLGVSHFGLHVENVKDAVAMFKARGANVGPTNVSGTKAILSNISDPNGVRMEMAELPPESLHRQAMNRWR